MIFRERLTVPLVWWLLAVLLSLSVFVAVGWYLGLAWGVGVSAACLAVAVAIFVSAATQVVVDAEGLQVGRARIEFGYLAGATALDEPATARRAGPEADARAYLVLRPYVRTAVEVTLDDTGDPTPYWLISSRRPDELASALSAAISTRLTE
jgi:Protein of unknown function (DUF3093)